MAIDTRSKRASVVGVAMAAALTLPAPDGTVGEADRAHVAYAYAGLAAAESPAAVNVTVQVRAWPQIVRVRA